MPTTATTPIIALRNVSKRFPGNDALTDISLEVNVGEVLCLLGDNGAGKSTLIKIVSGVHEPTSGTIEIDGEQVAFADPREARQRGIATVHQEVGAIPLMSVARNFFLGAEPVKRIGPFKFFDNKTASRVALDEVRALGIRRIKDARQLAGTLSGGERQALMIARAMYFGARVLILDEPTSALGVKESRTLLRFIKNAANRGVAVVFITHNAHHAMAVGDRFAVLIQGRVVADFRRGERTRIELLTLMAGGEELGTLEDQPDDFEDDE